MSLTLSTLHGLPFAFLGPTEWWIILAVALLLFGGRKLPELARAMGTSITQFRKGLDSADEDEPKKVEGSGEAKGE